VTAAEVPLRDMEPFGEGMLVGLPTLTHDTTGRTMRVTAASTTRIL
jgi:hypothetical protein